MNGLRLAVVLIASVQFAACSTVKDLLPFGEKEYTENSRKPANAAEYLCEGGKRFYVRTLDASAVWLIAPDREIRLEKVAGAAGMSYGAGRVLLELSGPDATLTDPPALFAGCKRADARS